MEGKELLDFLGIEATNLDEFKEGFSKKYYTEKQIHDSKDLLGKFTGKTLKRVKQAILNKAREKDIPFTQADFDNVEMVEDVFDLLTTKQAETFGAKLTELESQVGKGDEEKIKTYTEKITAYERSLQDEKGQKKQLADQLDLLKKQTEGQVKAIETKYFKNNLLSEVAPNLDTVKLKDPLIREGWESTLNKEVKFDYDEHGEIQAFNHEGKKFPDPKKADRWLSPKEVVLVVADKAGLVPKNPQGGQPAWRPPVPPPANGIPPPITTPAPTLNKNKLAPGMEQFLTK